ncbi:hypothetical protein HRI_000702300 [Hibiscus trionum]|uniref:CW-type domain-containing protein n=1 Tax=Hibiscus trionum TaxID=183268 RepID=A0A9W7H6N1_HIBTR|nr:hypothetical protein HRI_000702300 [Hibiscus trionum]
MDENSEPEEGEACYYRDDDDNINPDIAFSYLDEKIKNVLGHFQKDFEGGVFAENLGAKFGGYGSFLPTYERSPSRLSHPKTPQGNSSTPRSTNNLSIEGAFQNLKAPPSAPLTARPGNASCPSGLITAKRDSHLSFNHVAEKPALKDESFKRAEIPTDQKTLKVRIKVGSDTKVQKNAANYSGLGLDDSPSSSWGNSPEESGGTVTAFPGTTNESPTKILQVMTSYHVPGGLLISPLNDGLLCLLRKEKEGPSRDSTPIPLLKTCRENSSGLIDDSILGNGKELSEKKTKILIGKSKKVLESKHGNHVKVENDTKLLIRKKSENEIAGGKELLANDLKHTSLSNSVNVADSMEATPRVCDFSAEANQDASRGGLFSSGSSKKDSLESMSGRSGASGKKKKRDIHCSSVEKVWDRSVVSSDKNASLDLGDYGGSKCNQNTAPLKHKEDSKTKVGQEATLNVQNEINIPFEMGNTLFVGKKSKGGKNTGQIAADSMKESLRLDVGTTSKDTTNSTQSFSSGKRKMHKLKLQKDEVQGNHRDALDTNFKQKHDKMDPSTRLVHNRPKGSGPMDFEREQNGSLDKSKEISSDRTVDRQLLGVDAPGVVPHLTDKTLASQTTAAAAVAAAAPVVIEENWVQCDRCHKWRLLPFDTRPEQLPEKWLCSMLNWLPGMNRCDISEDDTTKALNALYQIPIAENQNNPQNHANGTMSAHLEHLDQKNSSFNSQLSSIQGKKNHGPKEVRKAGGSGLSQMPNSKKNQQRESLKSRSLKNMTQVPAEPNLTKKTSFQQNEKNPDAGAVKQEKMKKKRESGLYVNEGSKKAKTEVACTTDKHQSCNLDIRMMGLNTSASLPTQANGRSMHNYNECSNSGDVKHDLKERSAVSVKKVVDQTQASSDGMSLDMIRSDKMAAVKKRKLEDREDSQNGHKLYMKEECSESGSRNEKKLRVSKIEGKQSLRNDGDGTSNRKNIEHLVGGTEEVKSIDRNQQFGKHKKKSSSQKTLVGLDSLRRDSETGQILKAAMSSSSKVSGSHKTGVNFEEARGSPVESVSSSPMRTSYPEKLASTKGDRSGKDAAANTGIPPSGKSGRCWDGEGTIELVQSVPEMKVLGDFNPKSHKSSTLDCLDRNSICKISIKTKPSSRLGNSHLCHGDTRFAENGQHALERPHGKDRVNRECQVSAFSQKFDKGSQKKNSESSAADKMKVNDPADQQEGLCSRKNMKYQPDVGHKGHGCLQETIADCKLNFPKPSKGEKNNVQRRDPSGHWSSDSRKEARSNKKHDVDAKSAAVCSKKGKTAPEKNLFRDIDGQTKLMQVETRSGISKSSLHSEGESQQEIKGHLTAPEAEQGVVSDGFPVDSAKAIELPGKSGSKNGSNHSLGKHIPDLCMAHSPVRVNFSNQTVNNALNDAEKLRNYADHLKSSGFVFESNEIYFKAALKFLGAAALLETSNSESGRHGDTNQMQVYSTATKLCEMCAQEFEKSGEMAAAALAYKCMEVAYMRVVHCKHSTSCRDRNELQATLQMVPQGESPSSSASDVDNNLNNQQTVEKAPLAKGLVSHVGGTHVIGARSRPSFVRLLNFTQDVCFAMEASRKSQNAFTAANASLEKTQNTECIISVRKVLDFSFQDVDGFVRLLQQAMEAISRSGLGGARE